jgi:hypothetical protein
MSPEDYRRHAAECLGIAENIINPQHRARLIIIAQAWLQLARRAEEHPEILCGTRPKPEPSTP